MSKIQWQKSSFSGDRDECIELAPWGSAVLMRESENPEAVVATTPAKLRAFFQGVKAGEFDHFVS
jgi:hypothetical protein